MKKKIKDKTKKIINYFKKNSKKTVIVLLVVFSFFTRFYDLNEPKRVIFDETYFVNFAVDYFQHEYDFDIHPPLGKMTIALVAKASGAYSRFMNENPSFKFEFDYPYLGKDYYWFRFLSAIFGALFPFVIFLFVRKLNLNFWLSYLTAFLMVVENGLLTQSRFALLDIQLLFFGFLGLLLFLYYKEKKIWIFFVLGCVFTTFSVLVKWTGLSYIAIGALIVLFMCWEDRRLKKKSIVYFEKKFFLHYLIFVFIFIVLYLSIFFLHFKLQGKEKVGIGEIILENYTMYVSNVAISDDHPFDSKPYVWPFSLRSVAYYYLVDDDGRISFTAFFLNPVIRYSGLASLVIFLIFGYWMRFDKKVKIILFVGYFLNFIPFLFVKRPLFLYSYLTAYVFSIVILGFVLEFFINKIRDKHIKVYFPIVITVLALAAFLYMLPFNYGTALEEKDYKQRGKVIKVN